MVSITNNKEKLIFIVAFIVIISIIAYILESLTAPQTKDKDCVNYHSRYMIIMDNANGACNWLVSKLLGNGSGFHLVHYTSGPFKLTEKFILTRQ